MKNEEDIRRVAADIVVLDLTATEEEISHTTCDTAAPSVVRQHCSNYDQNYGCLRYDFCLMAYGRTCEYFDESVVGSLSRQRAKKYAPKKIKGKRYCKDCGAPVGKRKQYCNQCATIRKKKQTKKSRKGNK